MKRLTLTIDAPSIDGIGLKGVPAGAEVSVRIQDLAGTHFVSVSAPFIADAEMSVKKEVFKGHKVTDDINSPYYRVRRWKSLEELEKHDLRHWFQCDQDACFGTIQGVHERRNSPTHILPCEAKVQGYYRTVQPLVCANCYTHFTIGGQYDYDKPLRCPDCNRSVLHVLAI